MIVFLLQSMQQYFTDVPLAVGETYLFTKEQSHHAKDVLHLDHETIRLVYQGKGYFAKTYVENGVMKAAVMEEDHRINELSFPFVLAVALIRREKFELVLQKATELGVSRIVPFESSRCVVHAKGEKEKKQKERWQSIVRSAAEQCKRNEIPCVDSIMSLRQLLSISADNRLCAYEKADETAASLSACMNGKSTLVMIGPEGGFSEEEISFFVANHVRSVTLGKRILRAETAAVYACSVISEWDLRYSS